MFGRKCVTCGGYLVEGRYTFIILYEIAYPSMATIQDPQEAAGRRNLVLNEVDSLSKPSKGL